MVVLIIGMITVILIVHIHIAVNMNTIMDMKTITGMTTGIIGGRNSNETRFKWRMRC